MKSVHLTTDEASNTRRIQEGAEGEGPREGLEPHRKYEGITGKETMQLDS